MLIAGPTASGKSALALEVARAVGGTIVNADSMQVYGDLRVITARPTPDEEAEVPHRLYGHVDAAQNYSVGRWLADVQDALAAIRREGRVPILVGGTGLYLRALTQEPFGDPADPARRSATAFARASRARGPWRCMPSCSRAIRRARYG